MTTCTFVGSEVYDLDLYERLQGAVEEAVREAEEVEFLFYRRGAAFSHLCYWRRCGQSGFIRARRSA